ncbi:MAG: glycosyltransferase, partial [Bacteroidales bacterium]|nr:glycosyltransferase [Bacteroidales bacterium]
MLIDKNMLKISIVTPSFNSAKFIEDCIQSVLNQNYPNFENIIIDGGSTDGTIEILKKYPHLKWISEPDEGQSDALNKGFKLATGEWILWLNSDDRLCAKAIDTFLEYISKYNGIDLFYGHVKFINEKNGLIKNVFNIPYSYHLTTLRLYIPPSTGTLFRASILKSYHLDIEYHYIMDVVWFLRYGNKVHTKLINAFLSEFRVSGDNKTYSQIISNQVTNRHQIERKNSKIFYPQYAINNKSNLYNLLRYLAKIEYYLKKVII